MVLCACPGGWSGWEQGERGQGSPGNKIVVLACCGRLVLVCNTCITCNHASLVTIMNRQAGRFPYKGTSRLPVQFYLFRVGSATLHHPLGSHEKNIQISIATQQIQP